MKILAAVPCGFLGCYITDKT